MNQSKTQIIRNYLPSKNAGVGVCIQNIYRITQAITPEEKHSIRGILSQLKRDGEAENPIRGSWRKI